LLSLSLKTHKFKRKINNLMIWGELWISKNALLSSHSKRWRVSLAQSVWIWLSRVGLLCVATLSAISAFQSAWSEERNVRLAAKISGEKFSNFHSWSITLSKWLHLLNKNKVSLKSSSVGKTGWRNTRSGLLATGSQL
jgi:hypothetical protein